MTLTAFLLSELRWYTGQAKCKISFHRWEPFGRTLICRRCGRITGKTVL